MNEQITVLKDESLGGVQREYREVRRQARVGERIKIVDAVDTYGNYGDGDVYEVTRIDSDGDAWFDGRRKGTRFLTTTPEYVVLEPTDILVIDGPNGPECFRMVDRKAAVGDRVIAVSSIASEAVGCTFRHRIGEVGEVDGGLSDRVFFNGWYLVDGDYFVLEPVESEERTTPQPLSSRPATEQAAENIASILARVSGIEAQVAELAEAVRKVTEAGARVAVPAQPATPQAQRDAIVERAKADVKRYFTEDNLEYIVNPTKRTVVALRRNRSSKRVISRGIAKCAPGEVFNAWIGKAIAAHRLYELDVPDEYLDAPQPTEVRVGDVVTFPNVAEYGAKYRVKSLEAGENLTLVATDRFPERVGSPAYSGDINGEKLAIILDDSREVAAGTEVSA